MSRVTIIGGGLSGSEAAWQLAKRGIDVTLYEMRPGVSTGAHETPYLCELVCSNSLGSNLKSKASGLLKEELRLLGSFVLDCADQCSLPAGSALAVDRTEFSRMVTDRISSHPNIVVRREEITQIPQGPTIIATGPLTSPGMSKAIQCLTGKQNLFFYDAIAPIVTRDSIDMNIAFRASRYQKDVQLDGHYLNCPLDEEQYTHFNSQLAEANTIPLRSFEEQIKDGVSAGSSLYFESCLPVEVLARRGLQALSFGPMRPVGLIYPATGKRPKAIVQLRQDNLAGTLYNMVGFQTNLTYSEQSRVFRLIPGLENAEFIRYGQMHRNTFIQSPQYLKETLQFIKNEDLFFAGQITGVEGYVANIGTGLVAGINTSKRIMGENLKVLPGTTMIGALIYYITHAHLKDFQPMKANFGILPPLDTPIKNKKSRFDEYASRSFHQLENFLKSMDH